MTDESSDLRAGAAPQASCSANRKAVSYRARLRPRRPYRIIAGPNFHSGGALGTTRFPPPDPAGRPARAAEAAKPAPGRTPGNAAVAEMQAMKSGIHPVYETRAFHCYGCGTEWTTRTTLKPSSSDGNK